jgi:hypothetical protein
MCMFFIVNISRSCMFVYGKLGILRSRGSFCDVQRIERTKASHHWGVPLYTKECCQLSECSDCHHIRSLQRICALGQKYLVLFIQPRSRACDNGSVDSENCRIRDRSINKRIRKSRCSSNSLANKDLDH